MEKKAKSTKGKESRERIIDVALKIFMRKGFHGTSLSTVASKARVTKGGIYHYFSGKEDLYHQTIQAYFKNRINTCWLEPLTRLGIKDFVYNRFVDITENKKRIQQMMGVSGDDAILYMYTFLFEATRKYPEFQKAIDEFDRCKYSTYTEIFRKAQKKKEIRSDLDPELLAFEMDNYLQQLQYMKFVNPSLSKDDALLVRLFENYWKRLER
jgi:AcrR family transcriptional regulator